MKKPSICLLPEAQSLGGPRTFQQNMIAWAAQSNEVELHFDFYRADIDAFLVIGGPRRFLPLLWHARRQGVPVVQRLNGMNWIHRKRPSGLRYALHSEMANLSIAFFRRFVCDRIVYQSSFCQNRWNRDYGELDKKQTILYNGVDTTLFAPAEKNPDLSRQIDIMLIEGNLTHGMDFGLEIAVELLLSLSERFVQPIRLRAAGIADAAVMQQIQQKAADSGKNISVEFCGVCDKKKLIEMEQRAAFLFSAEIHPACPNAVIEAMACGLPVTGFDTGALKDVTGDGGIIVPYGSNAWNLEKPLTDPLTDAAEQLIRQNAVFRSAARQRALESFSIDTIARAYVDFCLS